MSTEGEPVGGEVTERPPPSLPALTSDEKMWAMFCHLSSLLGYMIGGFTFVGPLVCWLIKKDTSPFVDDQGKESLNFQINIFIYILVSIPIGLATFCIGFILTAAVVIYGVVMPIIAGLKANNGERYRYPLTFRIL